MVGRKKLPRPSDLSTIAGRLGWLLEKLWQGSQTVMSRDLGVDQSALSKILRGKRNAGRLVLLKVGSHPLVNERWLLDGEGDPLVTDRESDAAGGRRIPVAQALLPGPPARFSKLLTPQSVLVAGSIFRPTMYAVVATPLMIAGLEATEQIREGDYIVLDADPERWLQNVNVLDGKLCAVKEEVEEMTAIQLRRVRMQPSSSDSGVRTKPAETKSENVPPISIRFAIYPPSRAVVAMAIMLIRDL